MEDILRSKYFYKNVLKYFVCTIKNFKAIIPGRAVENRNQILNSCISLKMQLSAGLIQPF